jgi:hypothetical protein
MTILLLNHDCPTLKPKSYTSNEFHYLFNSRIPGKNYKNNKNDNKIYEIAELLMESKVDLFQRN